MAVHPSLRRSFVPRLAAVFALGIFTSLAVPVAGGASGAPWAGRTGTVVDAASVEALYNASDFSTADADVLRLYYAFFDRAPDLDGAKYWIATHDNGNDLSSIATWFAASDEFIAKYGAANTDQFLTAVYDNVLGRQPDAAGYAYWKNEINNKGLNKGLAVRWIAANNEFKNRRIFPGEDHALESVGPMDRVSSARFYGYGGSRWSYENSKSEHVTIPSTFDGYQQPAHFVPPSRAGRPVLVMLHSWSDNYNQAYSVTFARWAAANGWAMIAPDFRGKNDDAYSTASDAAIQDVVDAVHYAISRGGDPDRVFVTGFSGGGLMTLAMVGRHPELFAGGAAWVPVVDLPEWDAYNRVVRPSHHYVRDVAAACGGAPMAGTAARNECSRRSPTSFLENARNSGVPVYIAVGASDTVVPPSASLKAFNLLAQPQDQISAAEMHSVDRRVIPQSLKNRPQAPSFFDRKDPTVLLSIESGPTTLVMFSGKHQFVFEPGVEWMANKAILLDRQRG